MPLHEITPHVDKTLASVIERCLSFDPADRPGSAAEFASSLELQLSLKNRIARWIRTHKRIAVPRFVLIAVACCLLMYGIATREPAGAPSFRVGCEAYQREDWPAAFLAFALGMTGNRMRESIADYDSAIRTGFKSPIIDNNKGYDYFLLNKYDMARERLMVALKGGQHQQIIYHNLAVLEIDSSVRESRDVELKYIDKACEAGKLESAQLCLDAASSYAMAAGQQRRRSNLELVRQLEDLTIDCCQQALQLGALPAKLSRVQQLNPEIAGDARFVQLLNSKPTGKPEVKAVHRIDPLEHLTEPIQFDRHRLANR